MSRLLIIDDNKELLGELKEAFEGAGYEVYAAAEGKKALELSGKVAPDLLLLDLKLPDISGFEVALVLKKNEASYHIPIIAITGHCSDEERKYAVNTCGIKKCLTKPLDMEDLFKEIERILGEG
ncbi:MAG: response regulator [Elusimicrobiota bacterium]